MTSLAISFALFVTNLLPVPVSAEQDGRWGTLKGQFIYDGPRPAPVVLNIPPGMLGKNPRPVDETLLVDPQGGIRNVVVYVKTKDVKPHPLAQSASRQQVVLEAKGGRFEPHILTLTTAQTMVVRNSEAYSLNAKVIEVGGGEMNPLLSPAKEVTYKYHRKQGAPQPVLCNTHPWYKAYVLPRDNPYFAVSKPDGTFEIRNLPVGPLEFQVWHEKTGYLDTQVWPKGRFTLEIKPDDNDLGEIKLAPALFK